MSDKKEGFNSRRMRKNKSEMDGQMEGTGRPNGQTDAMDRRTV